MAIEINFEDLTGPGVGPATVEPAASPGMTAALNGIIENINGTINNFKELLTMLKGNGILPLLLKGPGAAPAAQSGGQAYSPEPTLMQQLQRLVNIAYSVYGDITLAQLLEAVVAQYGGTKLSAVLKALERIK